MKGKKLLGVAFAAFIAFVGLVAGCKSNAGDNTNANSTPDISPLVGTWEHAGNPETGDQEGTVTIFEDGKIGGDCGGTATKLDTSYYVDLECWGMKNRAEATVSGDTLTLTIPGGESLQYQRTNS